MLTSILVPVRNGERFIAAALDSAIAAAGDRPYEVVVQDAMSNDRTAQIVSQYPSIVHYVREQDSGQADGLNRALSRASGDIVGWLNADDLYEPGVFAAAVELFEADSAVDVVYGDWTVIDEDGRCLRDFQPRPWNWDRLYWKGNYIFSGATFFRRRVFDRFGCFSTDYNYVMDLEFFLRIGRHVSAVSAHRRFGAFRMHNESKSGSQEFRFCMETARLRRQYLSGGDATLRAYARAQGLQWVGAATTSLRYSPLYSRFRRHIRPS
jgi:glycosyltransferase involved in cell wall biosynthesis